jgi:MarR family protein
LLYIAGDPTIRLRDIADTLGITERAAHRIVDELVEGGYVARKRRGRRNEYKVRLHLPVHDPLLRDRKLADLVTLLTCPDGDGAARVKTKKAS